MLHLLAVSEQPASPIPAGNGSLQTGGAPLLCVLRAPYKNQTCLCGIRHLGRGQTHLFMCVQQPEVSAEDRLKTSPETRAHPEFSSFPAASGLASLLGNQNPWIRLRF